MKIALGTDHAGFVFKERVKALLVALGHEPVDFGTFSETPCDYPDFVVPAAMAVARGDCERGIVFGGSGNGEAMAANKIRGVRCGLCWTVEAAQLNRRHNDGNVLSLGGRLVPEAEIDAIVRAWLDTPFEGGRHVARLAKVAPLGSPADRFPTHEKTILIRPEFLNSAGNLFGGFMMKWADELAFDAATLAFPGALFVTKIFDRFDFLSPVANGDIIKIRAQVICVGNSSCTVGVWASNARNGVAVVDSQAVMVNLVNGVKTALGSPAQ
jgi:ribose 5-phosphate isomerase B